MIEGVLIRHLSDEERDRWTFLSICQNALPGRLLLWEEKEFAVRLYKTRSHDGDWDCRFIVVTEKRGEDESRHTEVDR